MTAITSLPMSSHASVRRMDISELPTRQRTQMERIIFAHTAHREEVLGVKPLNISLTRRSSQGMANYKYEVDHCDACGQNQPAIHIDVMRLTLDKMLANQA